MRNFQLATETLKQNRAKFTQQMKPNSLAVFLANDQMPKTGDMDFVFKQNTDFYYLSGVNQEKSILILYPDAPVPEWREVLFLLETNEYLATWEGEKLTKEKGEEVSGIQNIHWLPAFEGMLNAMMMQAENVYLGLNENDRFASEVPYKGLRFAKEMREKYPLHQYFRSAPIVKNLRMIKSEEEINWMQKACNVTGEALERVLKFTKPGVFEYEVEAEIAHTFIKRGTQSFAYDPIIASGKNACVLHYVTNAEKCNDGDLLLMDFGCGVGNYASDLSRTIPVNGRFTERQKAVYNAVLDVFKEAKTMLKPGAFLPEYQKNVEQLIEGKLIDLKVISKAEIAKQDPKRPLYKKYFPHGTSHHIGLDVHDSSDRYRPIEENMVFTCEPGIYIPEENIGVRIENDMVITANGVNDLMSHIPIEVDEIEDIMNA